MFWLVGVDKDEQDTGFWASYSRKSWSCWKRGEAACQNRCTTEPTWFDVLSVFKVIGENHGVDWIDPQCCIGNQQFVCGSEGPSESGTTVWELCLGFMGSSAATALWVFQSGLANVIEYQQWMLHRWGIRTLSAASWISIEGSVSPTYWSFNYDGASGNWAKVVWSWAKDRAELW